MMDTVYRSSLAATRLTRPGVRGAGEEIVHLVQVWCQHTPAVPVQQFQPAVWLSLVWRECRHQAHWVTLSEPVVNPVSQTPPALSPARPPSSTAQSLRLVTTETRCLLPALTSNSRKYTI
ncbi:hypothetical protein ElyMa_003065300 [Elysia marginata]|uniref:Uncharacterized protein n=1 Tax=Elysia marginata TaxID=1093978 RepID=A0AAV4IK10_9GAST|nr:hypothetical protein ElyMa_003065300 [Elysia marginata]